MLQGAGRRRAYAPRLPPPHKNRYARQRYHPQRRLRKRILLPPRIPPPLRLLAPLNAQILKSQSIVKIHSIPKIHIIPKSKSHTRQECPPQNRKTPAFCKQQLTKHNKKARRDIKAISKQAFVFYVFQAPKSFNFFRIRSKNRRISLTNSLPDFRGIFG